MLYQFNRIIFKYSSTRVSIKQKGLLFIFCYKEHIQFIILGNRFVARNYFSCIFDLLSFSMFIDTSNLLMERSIFFFVPKWVS